MSHDIPVTGAWRPGDPPGRRQFATLFDARPHVLETGGRLANVTVAYETWGELNANRDNALLVLHALTGDSHAAGPAGPGHGFEGWWDALVGPGKAIDSDRFFVVCPNVLGGCQGTTGHCGAYPDGSGASKSHARHRAPHHPSAVPGSRRRDLFTL